MAVESEEFRDALRHFPAGVTIVAVKAGEEIHGLTVSAFCSVSPSPPLIAVVIDHRHTAYPLLEEEGAAFAVSILGEDQRALSDRFAWVKDEDRFGEGDWQTAVTGAPVLGDALAWLDCTVSGRHSAGTHTIYVGEVQASAVVRAGREPLVYWNRGYRKLETHEFPEASDG
ncbi:MAG: flavin reductase family protein [Thermoanaerobaculia bacterium]|nr:flavin reductase family protein [Thermoanaerobaculia bacterium]